MAAMPLESLQFILNHVVLPPRLPQEAEDPEVSRAAERCLISLLSTQLKTYQAQMGRRSSSIHAVWTNIAVMLGRCALLMSSSALDTDPLVRAFESLDTTDKPSILPIYVRAQNAVLILRQSEESVTIECFEASPQSSAVMAARGALTRQFPAHAVSLPLEVFHDSNFQNELADKVSKLDIEKIQEMMPQSNKGGQKMGEIRDTTNPGLVTEMLMAILASLGEPVVCRQIQKRTRDDVIWKECLCPWRRSALWLAIRVAFQSTLIYALGMEEGTEEYKNFMIFFITQIAVQASAANLHGDFYHVIAAKVARRASKLGPKILGFVQDNALSSCQELDSKQQRTWKAICDQDGKRPATLDRRDFESETSLSLETSSPYLSIVLDQHQGMLETNASFAPNCRSRLGLHRGLPSLDELSIVKSEIVYTLAEFEAWISDGLSTWRQQHLTVLQCEDCMALAELTTKYRDAALLQYSGAPEQISTMILVIAELWYTLDLLASAMMPLLQDFSPGIASDFFNPLLLPKQAQMQRLQEIELHIAARQRQANPSNPSIFSDPLERSITVQFYASSSHHQALRAQIEAHASVKRTEKEAEWRATTEQFEKLKKDAKRRSCLCRDTIECQKCLITCRAEAMTIDVHEWPLPECEVSCISAVVELDCPTELAAWRNVTWMLVHDIGRQEKVHGQVPAARLSTYEGLQYHAQQKRSRLTLASNTKPFAKAHYHLLKLPVALDQCFAKNALQYKLFDPLQPGWISDQVEDPSIHTKCITPLPDGPYSNLQYAVDSVTHSQNEVIASQETCSKSLSLHEFLSFGSMRADGERVQWRNIKRELAASNLSLNTEAVCTLVTQVAWQASSAGTSVLRNAHLDLQDPSFCEELLETVSRLLESIKANWKSDDAMLLLITVALRVLSLSSDNNVSSMAVDLLGEMRLATENWTDVLGSFLHGTIEPKQILKLQQRLLKAALLCKMTFDVDDQHIQRMMSSADDLKIWAKSSMHVHDNLPGEEAMLSRDLRRLLSRDRKLSHAIHRVVRMLIVHHNCNGLELAIAQQWSGFQPVPSSWTAFESPNDRWLCTNTASSPDRRAQQVHFNMLEGELLVDGRPLGRLPTDYIRDELYLRLFGVQILNVFSSDMEGMLYMTSQEVGGYLIYFGKRGKNTVIRARKGSQVLELIPQHYFINDLPSAMVEEYFHWLDVARQEIEFRPVNQPWQSSLDNWCLLYQPRSISVLTQRDRKLIDIRSRTFGEILRIFGALETVENVHVTLSGSERLEVALPRYDLNFFLNHDGEFECRELCRVVDSNQSVGTLIGLQSRLVLSGVQKLAKKHDRILLIPEGDVSGFRKGSHVEYVISVRGPRIRLFQYPIDATLRRLQGGGDVYGTIYKAYLHAITSHTLPDPFTERTGTEEALVYLRQRSLGFIMPPDEKTISLLIMLSRLTPRRKYYPDGLKVMQRVKWDNTLSMIAQHDEFLPLADRIITSGNSYIVFYPGSQPVETLYNKRDLHLLERAKIRNSCFRSSDFGGDVDARSHDSEYGARDCPACPSRGQKSFEIGSLVRDWPTKLEVSIDLDGDLRSLGRVSGFGARYDPSRPIFDLLNVQLSTSWAPLLQLCQETSPTLNTYSLLFLFSIIAYGRAITSLEALRTLLAFAFVPRLRNTPVLPPDSYINLNRGINIDEDVLRGTIMNNMSRYNGPGRRRYKAQWNAENKEHQDRSKEECKAVLRSYMAQWPTGDPVAPSRRLSTNLDWSTATHEISALFHVWTTNGKFRTYLNQIQPILNETYKKLALPIYDAEDWHLFENQQYTFHAPVIPSLAELMSRVSPAMPSKPEVLTVPRNSATSQKNDRLRGLIAAIKSSEGGSNQHSIRKQYRDDLLASYDAFTSSKEQITPKELPRALTYTIMHRITCESEVLQALDRIYDCLRAKSQGSTLLELSGLWPRYTIRSLLANLSSRSLKRVSEPWRHCLIALAESITVLQRARRLLLAGERNDLSTFGVEIENEGHQGWETSRWPDWLLIEIEGDFLIRSVQARVALEMIRPSSSESSLVQLNMGEGKSSVIVPLIAVAIANGKYLSRIVVLKSLSKQMSDTVSSRLGGMVDRQIYFMPFSRKIQMDERVIKQIQHLHESCLEDGGILLAQPEHILSFKLMGIERLTSGKFSIASPLLKSQRWLESNARDILDESDELLDVKFQLIYTLGSQRMMDGQPDRWLITQGIFDLVGKHASRLNKEYPSHIEVTYRTGSSFPAIRLLSRKISHELVTRIAHDVTDSQLPGLNLEKSLPGVKNVVLNFIQNHHVTDEDCGELAKAFRHQDSLVQKLLLVRGFLAYRILLFALRSKRWSVNYGLHPTRCLSAVPYRAKGVPAVSAEFGHPDVAVALTCLSYYHAGLSHMQIRKSFELLSKSDDPSLEYSQWIKYCSELPDHLCSWHSINLEDDQQFYDKLFPALRYSKKLADFFMSNVVFPKEGKEFDEKLSTSGWDIVTKKGPHITTGFSGTNDNRFLLPLSISQRDLTELQHTSGKVLDYVLRKENLLYHCARDNLGRQLSTEGLITYIDRLDPSVKVLIDVGAQVLETSNRDFVKAWMEIASNVDAGIFFDDDDNIMVLTQDSKLEKLVVSSFQSRMHRCVVYLDEVHTRGTDLKLPASARAAVTLGPRLTKDRLVQACMRLRKLAQGQTLMFLAPPEVHQSILELTGKPEDQLDGYDVIAWTLEQSCRSIERSQPLRILQGLNHNKREVNMDRFNNTYKDLSNLSGEVNNSSELVTAFREKEEQRLNDLYAPTQLKTNAVPGIIELSQNVQNPVVQTLLGMWENLDSTASEGASMHEEHEREVAPEVEQETQVERPPKIKARPRAVDPDLEAFVTTGRLEEYSRLPMANDRVLSMTSVKLHRPLDPFAHLRVTCDFSRTVERPQSGYHDCYLRPVNWVLTSKREIKPTFLLIISPYEANELMHEIQAPSSGVNLHVYEPRVTKSMGSVDAGMASTSRSMKEWQNLSSGLRRELNLFAGQVYFNTYKDYVKLRRDLGLERSTWADQTLSFVQGWIAIRRKGQDFLQTHIGQLVSGRSLKEEAFE